MEEAYERELRPLLLTLQVLDNLRRTIEAEEYRVVEELRRAGVTWKAIGQVYGISLQAARQRFSESRRRYRG